MKGDFVITVGIRETPVFVLDESGRLLAPGSSAERAAVAAALAAAAAQLAALPAPTPFADLAARLIPALEKVGTDEAAAAMDLVAERVDAATKAVLAAEVLISRYALTEADGQIAQAERNLGATEH